MTELYEQFIIGGFGPDVARVNLTEAVDISSRYIDPRQAYLGPDGEPWIPLGSSKQGNSTLEKTGVDNEAALQWRRFLGRLLADESDYAKSAYTTRQNFVVGEGHKYSFSAKKGFEVDPATITSLQKLVDEFTAENDWCERQRESWLRFDRDGEVFQRMFAAPGKPLRVRFVEPEAISTPAEAANRPGVSMGVVRKEDDVETIEGYYVDGVYVDAKEIQHRKANVDRCIARGLPLFGPKAFRKLREIDDTLQAVNVTSKVRAGIALVRKVKGGTRDGVQEFAEARATYTRTNSSTGQTQMFTPVRPGRELTVPDTVDITAPFAGVNMSQYVEPVKASLRSVAAGVNLPEWMLTGDMSNGNYSSLMVSDGPVEKAFKQMQAQQIAADKEIVYRAFLHRCNDFGLSPDVWDMIEMNVAAPIVVPRNHKEEIDAGAEEMRLGILSPQTLSARQGLDYEQEQKQIKDAEASGWKKPSSGPMQVIDENGQPVKPEEKKPVDKGDDDEEETVTESAAMLAYRKRTTRSYP